MDSEQVSIFQVHRFFFKKKLCVWVCTCVPHVCLRRLEDGIGCPGTGVTISCEPPCLCWEPKAGPLEEQDLTTKLSLQSLHKHSSVQCVFIKIDNV